MADLTSTRSPRVAEVRRLHDRRHRAQRGAFVVEGPQAVEAALTSAVHELYVTTDAARRHAALVEQAKTQGAEVYTVTDDVLAAMAQTRQPQGLIAVCPLVALALDEALAAARQRPLRCVVVLDRANDPGNAGTVIRTADALGVGAVILTDGSVDPHNGKVVRSTAGSIFHIPIAVDVTVESTIAALTAAGYVLVAADARGSVCLGTMGAEAVLSGPVAWVIGNEAHGVHEDLRAAAHETVSIPMSGGAESLNMAAAAAICLYSTRLAQHPDAVSPA